MKTQKEFLFSNGDKVKEKVTGFEGTITGCAFYITGCNQYLVVAKAKNTHSSSKSHWYDEGRLELLQDQHIKTKDVEGAADGCDIPAPNRG